MSKFIFGHFFLIEFLKLAVVITMITDDNFNSVKVIALLGFDGNNRIVSLPHTSKDSLINNLCLFQLNRDIQIHAHQLFNFHQNRTSKRSDLDEFFLYQSKILHYKVSNSHHFNYLIQRS